ncbi:MAG: DUF1549 domain-containing protein [Planctomycetales bacterium]|nr:DUF1549 domain-containing protein [Planctomycetales bacterium]
MLLAVCNLLRNGDRRGLALGTASLAMMLAPQLGHSQSPADSEFFETRIRPVLVRQCYACHSSAIESPKGGLRLDSRAAIRRGGESGPAVVPGKPAESLLLDALRHESFEMPPGKQLPASTIADFQYWIEHGAVDPRDQPPTAEQASAASWQAEFRERSEWWSLQPRRQAHPTRAVDGFVVERLQRENLQLAPAANASVLLRRLCFVLTGLPPTEEQVAQFLEADRRDSKQAYRQLVDALLASPAFGERMARHWMDVVRYTDTYGYEWDISAKGSWEYRDYLTRAFNADVPFDQLVREQIAGDLLPQPRIDEQRKLNESLIGPMFYHFGEHRHGSSLAFNGIHQEMIHNKIDAFSKAFLGMTVACARCHDHKLDAISQADYYALAGVLMTPRWATRPIDAEDKHDVVARELRRLRGEIRRELGVVWQCQFDPADPGTVTPLVSPATLRAWAERQAEQLKSSAEYSPGWLLASLAASPGKAKAAGAPESPGDTPSDVTQAWQTLGERLAADLRGVFHFVKAPRRSDRAHDIGSYFDFEPRICERLMQDKKQCLTSATLWRNNGWGVPCASMSLGALASRSWRAPDSYKVC